MTQRPCIPHRSGEDGPAHKKRHNCESCQACRAQNINANRQASVPQERTRVGKRYPETVAAH